MHLARMFAVSVLCVSLTACQTFGQAQFIVPVDLAGKLAERVSEIALSHGMSDCMAESKTPKAIACYKTGESSFTFVGVRRHESVAVVDLVYRSAGIGGQLFAQLNSEILTDLRKTFGESLVEQRDYKNLIPIEYRGA